VKRSGRLERVNRAVIAAAGGATVTGLMRSCRYDLITGHEVDRAIIRSRKPAIYVLWHGRLLPCAFHYRDLDFGTMITRNRDGDYITGMIERWGFNVVRGSSSRGGSAALRSVLRLLRSGRAVALTPDGPRGPRQTMKVGPLIAAQIARVPIVPVSAGAARAWYFGRWDRFLVPKPFTRIPVGVGEPIEVPEDAGDGKLEEIRLSIERRLNQLTDQVDEAARAAL
jgi:lysophospholipid acyltransferase (LPLAT)-like uncharacterized protein